MPTVQVTFTNYVPTAGFPATNVLEGSDPWSQLVSDHSEYTSSTSINDGAAVYEATWRADFVPPPGVTSFTGWTLMVDMLAQNGGADPGPEYRAEVAFYSSADEYLGEFGTTEPVFGVYVPGWTEPAGPPALPYDLDVPYIFEMYGGALQDAILNGGYLRVRRYSNVGFDAGWALTIDTFRITLMITYLAGIPPRRIFGRSDGKTQGAKRVLGGGNSRQSGSRTLGSVL